MTVPCIFTINGTLVTGSFAPDARLLDVIRTEYRLTAAKEGCGEGECGSCAVLVDDVLVNSCLVPVAQIDGHVVTTLEGLPKDDPLFHAFAHLGGTQCGICTPGMILSARSLLNTCPQPSLDDVRTGLAGNLCRCTGYSRIYDAVLMASGAAS